MSAVQRKRWSRIALGGFVGLVSLWLVLPILIVIPLSITGEKSFTFPPPSYSLQWFENLFSDPMWRDSIINSARIALLSVIASAVIGTAAALALDRGKIPGRGLVVGLLMAPIVVPSIVVGVGIYAVFLEWQLIGTDLGFVLAHTVVSVPFVVITVSASLRGFDRTLERAAESLGASPFVALFTVTLPAIVPGIFAGAVFAFITSFDNLVVSQFLVDPLTRTLPVQMFVSLTSTDPTIAAASMILLIATTAAIAIAVVTVRDVREGSV